MIIYMLLKPRIVFLLLITVLPFLLPLHVIATERSEFISERRRSYNEAMQNPIIEEETGDEAMEIGACGSGLNVQDDEKGASGSDPNVKPDEGRKRLRHIFQRFKDVTQRPEQGPRFFGQIRRGTRDGAQHVEPVTLRSFRYFPQDIGQVSQPIGQANQDNAPSATPPPSYEDAINLDITRAFPPPSYEQLMRSDVVSTATPLSHGKE